eukprot:3070199-Rhodomonas_salina.1
MSTPRDWRQNCNECWLGMKTSEVGHLPGAPSCNLAWMSNQSCQRCLFAALYEDHTIRRELDRNGGNRGREVR